MSHLLLRIPIACLAAVWLTKRAFWPMWGLSSIISVSGNEKPNSNHPDDAGSGTLGRRYLRSRALIVGAGKVGRTLADHLEAGGRHDVVGFVDDLVDPIKPESEHLQTSENFKNRLLGTRRDVPNLVIAHSIDEVFVAYAPTWQQQLTEQLASQSPRVSVNVVPSTYEAMMRTSKINHYGDIALVRLHERTDGTTEALKRIIDVLVSFVGLFLFAPLLLFVSIIIRITSPGPIIFAQERIGQFGAAFRLYKFRTMREDAEQMTGPVLAAGFSDRRLTRFGRWIRLFRIDEVPQLWNVLRGDMSLVGPRPERPHFVNMFEASIPSYGQRHLVRPGITGLAQVCGDYHTDARDKLRFDLIYVSHRSILFDLNIILRTVIVVVFPKK